MTGFLIHDQVKEEMLFEALTTRKTVTVGEKLIVPYKLSEVRLFSIEYQTLCAIWKIMKLKCKYREDTNFPDMFESLQERNTAVNFVL